jgi:hypothetical protein
MLVEILVCIALLGVVIFVTGSLVEATLRAHAPENAPKARGVESALRSLRRDAALSTSAGSPGAVFASGPLTLRQEAATVRYELSGGVLTRTETVSAPRSDSPGSGRPLTRVVARGLTSFRHNRIGGVLGIQLGVDVPARRGRGRIPAIEDAWVALRGGKDGRSW